MKKRVFTIFLAVILIVITIFIHTEMRQCSVHSSTVYQSSDEIEIYANVLMNTFMNIDKESFAKEVISEHQKINGMKTNVTYKLSLYRTLLHYRWDWKYDTIICDENGAIICCEDDLGV